MGSEGRAGGAVRTAKGQLDAEAAASLCPSQLSREAFCSDGTDVRSPAHAGSVGHIHCAGRENEKRSGLGRAIGLH